MREAFRRACFVYPLNVWSTHLPSKGTSETLHLNSATSTGENATFRRSGSMPSRRHSMASPQHVPPSFECTPAREWHSRIARRSTVCELFSSRNGQDKATTRNSAVMERGTPDAHEWPGKESIGVEPLLSLTASLAPLEAGPFPTKLDYPAARNCARHRRRARHPAQEPGGHS